MEYTLTSKIESLLRQKKLNDAQLAAKLWASEQATHWLERNSVMGERDSQVHAIVRVACKRELRARQ